MRNWFANYSGGAQLASVAAVAFWLSGCMSYGETVVYQLYQTNADRCAQSETDACVALLQSKCEAPARVCTAYVPAFQAQASKQLSQKCRSSDEAACQALDAVACDDGAHIRLLAVDPRPEAPDGAVIEPAHQVPELVG